MCPRELVYYISIHFFSTRRKLHLLFYVPCPGCSHITAIRITILKGVRNQIINVLNAFNLNVYFNYD